MANFQFLAKEDLSLIAGKLATWMPAMSNWQSCETSESIEMFTVSIADLQSDKPASACLQKMNCWQIQVLISRKPSLVARVAPVGSDWQVYSVYGEELAIAMDKALTWIDTNVHDGYIVRMFQIPDYYIAGFTFEKGDDVRVYIVNAAPGISIDPFTVYAFDDMRKILATQRPIHGVGNN